MSDEQKDRAVNDVEPADDAENTTENTADEDIHAKNVVNIEDTGPCKKKISIEIPEETVKNSLQKGFKDLQKEAVVPGFRKGRAPMRLVEKRFGTEISLQVKLKLLADASKSAIDSSKLDILGDPDIDHEKAELPETGPMRFDFEVEVRPEFDLPELEGIAVEKPAVEITEQDIEDQIMEMRNNVGIWAPKEGAVAEKDQVVVDAVIAIEGVEEHERLDNTEVFVRKTGFVGSVPVEDLPKLLSGAKVGDEKKTTVNVPKTFFNEQYRGKKVDVTVTIKEIKHLQPAELNDAFLERFGVDDVEELKDNMMEYRRSYAERQARSSMADQIYKYLLDKTDLDLPESIVADQSVRILQRQYSNLLMQRLPQEQIDQQMQQLRASSEEKAKEQLKLFFITDKIAEKLGVTTTEEEINGHIAQVAASGNRRPEKVREELVRNGSLAEFSLQVREQKCIEKLLESAKIIEVKAKSEKKAEKKTAEKQDEKEPAKKAAKKETDKTEKKVEAKKETAKTEKKAEAKKKPTRTKKLPGKTDKKSDKK